LVLILLFFLRSTKRSKFKRNASGICKHRKDVIVKRTKYDLKKAKDRGHVVEGLMVAIANIDEIITIIKKSKGSQKSCRISL
jgi:DNA gyrase subunit A